jgi:hypothetical protein
LIGEIPLDRMALLFDAVVAVLLLATIVYAAILNRKLSALRDSRREMEELIGRFAEATAKAETVLADIRQSAGGIGRTLQETIDRGNVVADDLVFLVERAGGLADRLEGAVKAKPAARRTGQRTNGQYGAQGDGAQGVGIRHGGDATSDQTVAPPLDAVGPARAEETPEQSAFMKSLRGMR